MEGEFSQKIAKARQSAERQDFHDAETALRDVLYEAGRTGDTAALAEARGVAAEIAQMARTGWPRWQRRFSALAMEPTGSPSTGQIARQKEPISISQWVSACVILFGIAAALSALGGLIVFFDQVGPDTVAAITGLIVGAIAAALWIGLAVALVLLREIAAGIRTLTSRA